ncbi:ABC transporter substrate-binding protein [Halovulum sp. GXIMD14794]
MTGKRLAALKGCVAGIALLTSAGVATAAGDLVIAMPSNNEPATFDGQIDPYQSTWLVDSLITDPLVVMAPDGQYIPGLATDWAVDDDGKTWTFTLREGVTFHDGTPFDAAAVKANFERVLAPETGSAQLASDIGPIASMEVVSPTELVVKYDEPWITLLDAVRRAPLWSPKALETAEPGDMDAILIGTGPFKFVEWAQNDYILLEKWEDYGGWNAMMEAPGPVGLDSVRIRFIGEAAVLGQMLATGEATMVYDLPPLFSDQYVGNDAYQLMSKGQAGTGLQMVMNVRNPPLNDIRVRQALQHAKDSPAINDLLYDGLYQASDGPLNNIHPCFWEGASSLYPHDTAKAAALLDEAGWVDDGSGMRVAKGVEGVEDGTPLTLRWSVLHHQEIGEVVQAQFKEVGIGLEVQVVPGPVQLEMVTNRDFELIYERQRSPSPLILDQVWNSKWDQPGGWAWTGYADPELDALLEQLRAIADADARCEVAREAQKIIMENALMLPTLSQPITVGLDQSVKGFQMGAEGNWFFLHNASIED